MSQLNDLLEDLGILDECKRLAMRMEVEDMLEKADARDRALILEQAQELFAAEED